MAASVKHSKESNEQYTPKYIVDPSREVLGTIDLDPATSELANKCVQATNIFTEADGVRTFEEEWHGNVFMNPPGGGSPVLPGIGLRSNPSIFWAKLMHAWHVEKTVHQAIVVGFTMEVLQSTQGVLEYPMARFPMCIPRKRIAFDVPREEKIRQMRNSILKVLNKYGKDRADKLVSKIATLEASDVELIQGDMPPHGNVIILVPPLDEHKFGESVPYEHPEEDAVAWASFHGPVTRKFQRVFSDLGYVRV